VQALEILASCTTDEVLPWHEPPRLPSGHVQPPGQPLWARMFELSRTPLVSRLVALWDDPFPGARSMALRVFAFFASWLRHWYAPGDQPHRFLLSRDILSKLQVRLQVAVNKHSDG
jgi:hypothetical protein